MFSFLRRRKKTEVMESAHNLLISRIREIRADQGNRVFSPDNAHLRIRALYRTIQEYNQFLNRLNHLCRSPNHITPKLFQNVPVFISLEDWFVGQNGLYLKANEEIITFQQYSIHLIESYIVLETQQDEVSIRARSCLGSTLSHVSEITQQLLLVTSEEKRTSLQSSIKASGY